MVSAPHAWFGLLIVLPRGRYEYVLRMWLAVLVFGRTPSAPSCAAVVRDYARLDTLHHSECCAFFVNRRTAAPKKILRCGSFAPCCTRTRRSADNCKASSNLFLGLRFSLGNLIWIHANLLASSDKVCSPDRASTATQGMNSAVNFLLDLDIKKSPLASCVHLSSRSSFSNPLLRS